MDIDRLTRLEEQASHHARMIDELNEVVTAQSAEIAQLTQRVEMLTRRLAEAEAADPGSIRLADQKPPHW